ncbi:MAG: response regulator [Desulfobulbaceae bacterium]|nr:response regulator [Desulfobulbaceae bacterium]MDY0351555.1 response regulator [Desulfobulbaceae bacterium]
MMLFPDLAKPVSTSVSQAELLDSGEYILLVDDYPEIVRLLREFLQEEGLPAITAGSVAEFQQALRRHTVALAILDIGLPDGSGVELLPRLKEEYPDMAIVMLTAVTDLHTALECMRQGADDYLTKPVRVPEFYATVRKVLEKRRLAINMRLYQRRMEQANFRINLLHQLTIRMNSAYLTMVELDEILQAILIGITAEEGLRFNRAFLALFNDSGETLEGRMAIGPGCRDEAGRIWQEIQEKDLRFNALIDSIKTKCRDGDAEVNAIIRSLRINSAETDHILIRAATDRRSILVVDGNSEVPPPAELIRLLGEDTFVIVPLYSPGRSLGVIIADHFVTRQPITGELVKALESFASQASLAIEHCRLYMDMENKIRQLEAMTYELEKNKDLLVEAERFSALGHMAAQLVHNIRNPITTIGGTARLLARKTEDSERLKFLNIMINESTKIEETLKDLFSFVNQQIPVMEQVPLYPLIIKSVVMFYNSMQKQHITQQLILPDPDPTIRADQHQFRQMLVHLIRNAIEAMSGEGELIIEVSTDDNFINLAIRDTGIGISDQNLSRAADPFFTTKTFGTGMGLTVVKRIVKDHNGTMKLRNRPKGGTEVILRFQRQTGTPG